MHGGQFSGAKPEQDVIPFAKVARKSTQGSDQLDKAGEVILNLVQSAARVADENSRHALDVAQKLSHQLRIAEERIAELEAEVTTFRDRAERAEQWLHRVYTEIEERFLRRNETRRKAGTAATI